jgi:hypothetical protein
MTSDLHRGGNPEFYRQRITQLRQDENGKAGNTKGGNINVPLTSCLTSLN